MSKNDYKEVFEAGRRARAAGILEHKCPYYRPENMPAQTGEDIEVFNDKYESWMAGWKLQNIIMNGKV